MSQSLVKNYVHIVFSTKGRQPLIIEEIEEELFRYIGGICKEQKCYPLQVGGYRNHIHILCNLSKNVSLAKLMEEIKSHSSKWIKTTGVKFRNFYWQSGYACFSINYNRIEIVKKYILNQKEHHQTPSFKNELRQLLNQNEIDFDERYLWD